MTKEHNSMHVKLSVLQRNLMIDSLPLVLALSSHLGGMKNASCFNSAFPRCLGH